MFHDFNFRVVEPNILPMGLDSSLPPIRHLFYA